MFNRRIVTLGAICLIIYAFIQNRDEHRRIHPEVPHAQTVHLNPHAYEAKHIFTIDPDKRYDDYSLTEKIIYQIYKYKTKKSNSDKPQNTHKDQISKDE